MIQQALEKVAKLLRGRAYSAPQIFNRLYAFLLAYAQRLQQEEAEYTAIALYADAHRLFKKYLVDEPFQLTKLTIQKLMEAISTDNFEHFTEIFRLRDEIIKTCAPFEPVEAMSRGLTQEMTQFGWINALKVPLRQSNIVKAELEIKKKGGETLKYSEMAIISWYRQYKNQYIVHIQQFIDYFLQFARKHLPLLSFLNSNCRKTLKQLADPDKKYYVTVLNCDELLLKLRQPEILQKLCLQSKQEKSEDIFKSQHGLHLSMSIAGSKNDQKLILTGQKVQISNLQKIVRLPPSIMVGSAVDSDLIIKTKYISRKQMLIIQDRKQDKTKQSQYQSMFFSIVCLSQTNPTIFTSPNRTKAHPGTIFFSQNVKYQIMVQQKIGSMASLQEQEDNENTLSLLPAQNLIKQEGLIVNINLLILSGEDKEQQISLSSHNFNKKTQKESIHLANLRECLSFDEAFYLNPKTRILLKTSNQILQNRLSRKMRLMKGMQIHLEEYALTVE